MPLYIPPSVLEREVKFRCLLCDTPFYEGQLAQYERHVAKCAKTAAADRAEAMSLRRRAPGLFDPNESGDVEFGKWVRDNRGAIWRGDTKM